jgi:hypothetical protein
MNAVADAEWLSGTRMPRTMREEKEMLRAFNRRRDRKRRDAAIARILHRSTFVPASMTTLLAHYGGACRSLMYAAKERQAIEDWNEQCTCAGEGDPCSTCMAIADYNDAVGHLADLRRRIGLAWDAQNGVG